MQRREQVRLNFTINGNGDKVMLTFHGFGQVSADYAPVNKALSQTYTFYNFDLFFHGESVYLPKKPVSKARWMSIIDDFLKAQKIDKFSVAGFSLGCRLAFPVIEKYAERIDDVILIAPDGLKLNFWYRLATSVLFRKLFKLTVFKPRLFRLCLKFMKKARLANDKLIKIAEKQMDNYTGRYLIYKTWTAYRKIRVGRKRLTGILNAHAIPVKIIISSHDALIPGPRVREFAEQLPRAEVYEVDTPHRRLLEKSGALLGRLHENSVLT